MSLVFAFVLAFPSSAAGTDPESRLQARFTELMAGLFHNGADIEVYNADNVDITDSFRAQFASDADSGNYQAMYDYLSSIEATVVKTSSIMTRAEYVPVSRNFFKFLNKTVDGRVYNGLIDYDINASYTYNPTTNKMLTAATPTLRTNEIFFEGAGDGRFVYDTTIDKATGSVSGTMASFALNFTLSVQYQFGGTYLPSVTFPLNQSFSEYL